MVGKSYAEVVRILKYGFTHHRLVQSVLFDKSALTANRYLQYPCVVILHKGTKVAKNTETHDFVFLVVDSEIAPIEETVTKCHDIVWEVLVYADNRDVQPVLPYTWESFTEGFGDQKVGIAATCTVQVKRNQCLCDEGINDFVEPEEEPLEEEEDDEEEERGDAYDELP